MNKIVNVNILLLLLCCGCFAQSTDKKAKTSKLSDIRVSITVEKQSLGAVFRELMSKYQIDIGFEQSTLDYRTKYFSFDTNMPYSARSRTVSQYGKRIIDVTLERNYKAGTYPISLDVKDVSIKELFDAIVGQMDHYSWMVRDEVVNIYPSRGRDPRLEKLLNIKIRRFVLPKESLVEDIIPTLLTLPEFMKFEQSTDISFFAEREGLNTIIKAQYHRPIGRALDFRNLRLRDLLNKITRIKKGGWILKMKGKTLQGSESGDLDI